jgi:hypothetical protein
VCAVIVTRHGRRPIILRASATVGVAATVLAGCTGGGSGAPSGGASTTSVAATAQSPSSSPSPTPSPSLVPPVLPAAAKQPTQAGAEAFFKYFIETYNYAYAALDLTPMKAICDSASKFCAGVYSGVGQLVADGRSQTGARVHVTTAQAGPISGKQVSLIDGVVRQDPGSTLDVTGNVTDTLDGHAAKSAKAVVQWLSGAWRIMAMEIVK